jgi:hypothetical protein
MAAKRIRRKETKERERGSDEDDMVVWLFGHSFGKGHRYLGRGKFSFAEIVREEEVVSWYRWSGFGKKCGLMLRMAGEKVKR